MSDTCYLCVELRLKRIKEITIFGDDAWPAPFFNLGAETYVATRVVCFSEPPHGLTRDFNDPTVYACIYSLSRDSYQEALDEMRTAYPLLHRRLAAQFASPE